MLDAPVKVELTDKIKDISSEFYWEMYLVIQCMDIMELQLV